LDVDAFDAKLLELDKVHTDNNVVYMMTKALSRKSLKIMKLQEWLPSNEEGDTLGWSPNYVSKRFKLFKHIFFSLNISVNGSSSSRDQRENWLAYSPRCKRKILIPSLFTIGLG